MDGYCFYVAFSGISAMVVTDIVVQTPNFDLLAGINTMDSYGSLACQAYLDEGLDEQLYNGIENLCEA